MFRWHQTLGICDSIPNLISIINSCNPWIDLSNDISCASNGDSMPKLQPREINVPIYLDETHSLAFHLISSQRVRFLDVYGFPLFLNNK